MNEGLLKFIPEKDENMPGATVASAVKMVTEGPTDHTPNIMDGLVYL